MWNMPGSLVAVYVILLAAIIVVVLLGVKYAKTFDD